MLKNIKEHLKTIEKHPMFIDWKNVLRCQYYRFNTPSIKIGVGIFAEIGMLILTFIWKCKGLTQNNLEKQQNLMTHSS